MLITTLKELFTRDLTRLKNEIELYTSEDKLWLVEQSVANSAGNLCLHLIGNLNAYIGAELGKTGYIRQREREFSDKDVSREVLLRMIEDTKNMIEAVLENLASEDLSKEFPKQVFGKPMTTAFFLIHLTTHLGYHLGQINYHRRLLDHS